MLGENIDSLVALNEPEALLAYVRKHATRKAAESALDETTLSRWRALASVLEVADNAMPAAIASAEAQPKAA